MGGCGFTVTATTASPWPTLVSSDRQLLLRAGEKIGLRPEWLQHKPLKDPRTGKRVNAWHWDLRSWSLEACLPLVEKAECRDRS